VYAYRDCGVTRNGPGEDVASDRVRCGTAAREPSPSVSRFDRDTVPAGYDAYTRGHVYCVVDSRNVFEIPVAIRVPTDKARRLW